MEKNVFDQMKEEVFHEKLDNGLNVFILPKQGFNKTYVTFTTNYGSIDNEFIPNGESDYIHVPDGIAHFLEHKMFEKEDGDVFQKFSSQGASANAFTSFTRTAYLFSATSNIKENTETLIDFVQAPYFTEQTVEKEKGIIGQEIRMYDDNPDWRVYFGLIENLYEQHPVKIDIAGTVESITDITKDHLYTCYNTFYHPVNMTLFIVGPVDPADMMQLVRDNQAKKSFPEPVPVQRRFPEEPEKAAKAHHEIRMNVNSSKCEVGFKMPASAVTGREKLREELAASLLLEMLFGKTSRFYEKAYSAGLIDDTFGFDYTGERGFSFALVGGDTDQPETLEKRIQKQLLDAKEGIHLSAEAFDRARKKKIGSTLRAFNSPEFIANQFTRYQFNGLNLFETVPVLEEMTLEDVTAFARKMIEEERFSSCFVLPKETA
ncbi:EF-P 5-aminopentanol modification-associated protein YfmH [Domibacillus enclensis]|uniref:Peptidase M16 n=1 Tax=Domibacillus enclensis TaxID=1017273 RepID=A0A1N6US42_9BACI|nr:pitrilysin family protein [Domibacillus enclensis]OXS78608.1 peptidase M16 [Domibacillus enclensis]SIQ68448.1 Predicted Zn-dependent peptidase [Domibacillus enclensis]